MECGCSIDVETDGSGPSVFSSADRKARKEHKCCECGRTIQKDETYRYESGIWDGSPSCFKTCANCLSVRDTYFCQFEYERIWELMDEYIYEGDMLDGRIFKLTPAARDRVLDMHQQKWDEKDEENLWTDYSMRMTNKWEVHPGYNANVFYLKMKEGDKWYNRRSAPEWTEERAKEMGKLRNFLEKKYV